MSGKDPWKHRANRMRCGTCMWHVTKASAPEPEKKNAKNEQTDSSPKLGRCRRHAPTMNGYPAAFEQDWCGDHKLDENKI